MGRFCAVGHGRFSKALVCLLKIDKEKKKRKGRQLLKTQNEGEGEDHLFTSPVSLLSILSPRVLRGALPGRGGALCSAESAREAEDGGWPTAHSPPPPSSCAEFSAVSFHSSHGFVWAPECFWVRQPHKMGPLLFPNNLCVHISNLGLSHFLMLLDEGRCIRLFFLLFSWATSTEQVCHSELETKALAEASVCVGGFPESHKGSGTVSGGFLFLAAVQLRWALERFSAAWPHSQNLLSAVPATAPPFQPGFQLLLIFALRKLPLHWPASYLTLLSSHPSR